MPFASPPADVEPPPEEALKPCPEIKGPTENNPDRIAVAASGAVAEYVPCQISHAMLVEYVQALRKHGVVKELP